MYKEIFKLDEMLTAAGLPHTLNPFYIVNPDEPCGYQIHLYKDEDHIEIIDDCVCHSFSNGYSMGLLETLCLSECAGFETAEEVFEGWKEMYAEALRK